MLLAIAAIQFGAAIATHLFSTLGADGTVALRVFIAAILLGIVTRTSIASLIKKLTQHWKLLLVYASCMAAMNLFFYLSIDRIPLGAAVAFEFIGPLSVAAFTSKRLVHLIWVALAAFGIALLSPLTGTELDPVGIFYALAAGTGWALFIILSRKVSDRIPGNDGLLIGMSLAALILFPLAVPAIPALFSNPWLLVAAFGVALLSTTLPFAFEFEALKKMPMRNYGILVSLEPAFAAAVGAAILGERLGTQGILAIACVVAAAIGISLSDRKHAAAASP